jgi:hypothetical protein
MKIMSDLVLRSELSRARAHLLDVQCELAFVRQQRAHAAAMRMAESAVLAALSWVWEEQEKQKDRDFSSRLDEIIEAMHRGHQLGAAPQ